MINELNPVVALLVSIVTVVLGGYYFYSRMDPDENIDDLKHENSASENIKKVDESKRHYAWASNIQSTRETLSKLGVDHTPKPVSNLVESSPTPNVGSSWNAAGTFEDKNVSSKSNAILKELLGSCKVALSLPNLEFQVTSVDKCSGEATIVFARNKKRIGYEYETVQASFQVLESPSNEEVGTGKVTFESIEDTEPNIWSSFRVSYKASSTGSSYSSDMVKKTIESLRDHFRSNVFDAWIGKLKEL
jgi:Activator of Hsp90 ATPase, N-terminal